MKLLNVAGLYLARLRGRVGQELLALVGIAAGVSLLFAALVANASLNGSFEQLTKSVVGDATLQLSARGSQTLDESLVERAQRVPSVAHAAALLEVRAEAAGPHGRSSVVLTGVTPDFAELGGTYTRGFSYSFLADVRAVALPTPLADRLGLALGQQVQLNVSGRRVEARLGAKLQEGDVGALLTTPVLLAPLRYAQELAADPRQITRLFVVPQPGRGEAARSALQALAGDRANVLPADFDAHLFAQASLPTNQSTTMFSLFGALVGFLFAFSAMLLTVPQRRHLITDLDDAGYRPATIVKALMFDAVVLGVVASVIGILFGDQLARRLFDDTPSFLEYAFPVGSQRVVTVETVALAAAGGLVASCVAVVGPTLSTLWELRRDDFSPPATERVAAARPWSRRWTSPLARRESAIVCLGTLLLGAGITVVAAAPASSGPAIAGLAALTLSMLTLLPAAHRVVVMLFDAATDRAIGIVPVLVSFGVRDRSARARSLAVAATGAVAVFSSVALQGAHADLLRGLQQTSKDVAQLGELWALAPGDANLLVTTPITASQLNRVPGISSLDTYRGGFLDIGDRRVRVFGPSPDGPLPISSTQLLEGSLRDVEMRLRAGGAIVISEGVARDRKLRVGDTFVLPSPHPVALRVVGLSTNMGWPPGAVILNGRDYERAWGSSMPSAIVAQIAPGASVSTVRLLLSSELAARGEWLTVRTAAERIAAQDAAARDGVARLQQIATLVLISAVVAMAAAMGGMVRQRRAFIASVKVDGYKTREMWLVLVVEATILIGTGCAAGAMFGLLGQSLLSRALTSVTGFPVIYSPTAIEALITCVAVTVAAVAIVGAFGATTAAVPAESRDLP